jgi:hypothetical protein
MYFYSFFPGNYSLCTARNYILTIDNWKFEVLFLHLVQRERERESVRARVSVCVEEALRSVTNIAT